MSRSLMLVLLDAGPLGLATNPRESDDAVRCKAWLKGLLAAGVRVAVPSIADYEVRRELLRAGKAAGLRRLDALVDQLGRLPVTDEVLARAAELWAQARREGRPTADAKALDADAILAATALLAAEDGYEALIATTNVGHLSRYADARRWDQVAAEPGPATAPPGPPAPELPAAFRAQLEEFTIRLMEAAARARVADLRTAGVSAEDARSGAVDLVFGDAPVLPSGIDLAAESLKEAVRARVDRAIEEALAEPPAEPLDEATRRLPDWSEGSWITLADGRPWSFHRPDMARVQLEGEGGTPVEVPRWIMAPWGHDLLGVLRALAAGAASPQTAPSERAAVESALLLQAAMILLRCHYRLTDAECKRLMPISTLDPECLGYMTLGRTGLAGELSEEQRRAWGEALGQNMVRLAGDLFGLIAPMVRAERSED